MAREGGEREGRRTTQGVRRLSQSEPTSSQEPPRQGIPASRKDFLMSPNGAKSKDAIVPTAVTNYHGKLKNIYIYINQRMHFHIKRTIKHSDVTVDEFSRSQGTDTASIWARSVHRPSSTASPSAHSWGLVSMMA